MAIVGKENFKIVLNKFLTGFIYSLVVFLIVVGMSWIQGGGLPPVYAVYGSLIYALLESLLKFFRKYKPEQYEEFKWIYQIIIDFFVDYFKKK